MQRGKDCDHRVQIRARRTAEYEEELWGTKERQSQLLDAVRKKQPRIVFTADDSEDLCPEWQEQETPHIKEEEKDEEFHQIKEEDELQPPYIKKEEEEAHCYIKEEEEEETITMVRLTGVPFKSEDEDGQSEDNGGAQPPSSSSSQHMTTEGDRGHCGRQVDGLSAPLSNCDDMSHSSDYDDDDDDKQSEGHADKKHWKCSQCKKAFKKNSDLKQHMRTHSGEKPFACSVCSQTFSQKGSLRKHTRIHTDLCPVSVDPERSFSHFVTGSCKRGRQQNVPVDSYRKNKSSTRERGKTEGQDDREPTVRRNAALPVLVL
ncbi:zinc finger protein 134-like isoform X3 [Phyllopteryx taeniolatus]|uniref:zinc finger protein 134-like isoform X3 n=1 Tax=Phyllopteryx taeniolatus TaxID=161469 RepID=UPI002AD28628|nr:zinc finger protein 134-like isoform X3 [Phyllopteryx taeniolatus]